MKLTADEIGHLRSLTVRLEAGVFYQDYDGDQELTRVLRRVVARMQPTGVMELDALYRFHNLCAEARAQALHLTSNRERFILREYVSQQVNAECADLEAVAEAIEKRKADQSPRVARLRLVASGKPWGQLPPV